MKPINSTYKILAWTFLERLIDDEWVIWAVNMMEAGFDTEHLVELAGASPPYNQFELRKTVIKIFDELGINTSDTESTLENYITFQLRQVLDNKADIIRTLRDLNDLYLKLDYDIRFSDFSLLYYAKVDLEGSEVQWYWEGANRENIDSICFKHFYSCISEHPLQEIEILN